MSKYRNKLVTTGIVAGLGLAAIPALAIALGASSSASATGVSGAVRLNAEVATAIAMKIASPNDTNPDCMAQSGITYGVANRYATSNGAEGSKQVDTFDGTTGGADEINTNTSCATLTMTPNTFDSTYSDITVYTNSPNGYAVSLQAAEPNLVNTTDSTQYIPAGTLTESNNTVSGGQNKWAYKTNNGIITNWTAVTTTDATIKSYDQETSGGDTTRVTYGISAGNNPTGKYATTLTYTATMFDGANPYVSKLNISTDGNITTSATSLSIPFGASKTITATPAEGYYLSAVTCPEGFTCTGYNTGIDYTGAQTITVLNNSRNNTGTVGLMATATDPWACPTATKDNPCTVNGIQYIRLADGYLWTKSSQGTVSWENIINICPSGTVLPPKAAFDTLVSDYPGSDLYNTTGWSGLYWSASEGGISSLAYFLNVDSSSASVSWHNKANLNNVVCYRS